MSKQLVDLTMQLHAETEKAIRVSDDGEDENALWLAKSLVEIERKPKSIVIVTMPEWLAIEKRLV